MKVSQLIEALQQEDPNLKVELRKVLGITRHSNEGFEVYLDSPIVGLAAKDDEVCFIVEAGSHLLAFGEVKNLQTGKALRTPEPKACGDSEGLTNPFPVKCQCKACEGQLQFDGFNKMKTLSFLQCDTCKCYWVANHSESELKKAEGENTSVH